MLTSDKNQARNLRIAWAVGGDSGAGCKKKSSWMQVGYSYCPMYTMHGTTTKMRWDRKEKGQE